MKRIIKPIAVILLDSQLFILMKKIILSISLLSIIFSQSYIGITDGISVIGDNIGITDGISVIGDNIGITDGISVIGKNIYLTDNYSPKKNELHKVYILTDGISVIGNNIGITDGISVIGDNYGFTSDPNTADMIIVVDLDLITKILSGHSVYKTIIKNHHSSSPVTNSYPNKESTGIGFKTKIDEDNDDVLILDNGAIVEISYGYLGYLGYRKDCIVYKSGSSWKIWIEGKKSFSCTILKEPSYISKMDIKEVTISKISDNGDIIFLTDGSVYEVSYQSYETTLWLGYSSALLINGYQIINLDEGSEIIDIIKIK